MEHLDTRPQDRRWAARHRWLKLRREVKWLCADLFRALGTPKTEALQLRLKLALAKREAAGVWYARWSRAEVGR